MSDDRETQSGQSARLLRALIWAGVGLASVAAVVVLLGGSDNSVRFAVVLIAVCVVLIGTSILIRSDPVLLGMDTEDRFAAQAEAVREELRAEIAAASRATAQARPEPGHIPGGRAMVTASAPGWPDADQPVPRPRPGQVTGGRAVVAVGAVSPPALSQAAASAQAPRQRGAARVPPPMAPVFRPPTSPAPRGAEYASSGSGQVWRSPASQSGQYGTPRRVDEEPSYGGQPGWSAGEPSFGGQPEWPDDGGQPGWADQGGADQDGPGGWVDGDGQEPWRSSDGPIYGRPEPPWVDDDPSYGGQPGWVGNEPGHVASGWAEEPDRPHKRRADVTAIDLGYTGRRSRPGHARSEGGSADDDSGADQYWRQPTDHNRR